MIGTESLGKRLPASRLVEHAANTDTVDMRRFNTESDDPPRETSMPTITQKLFSSMDSHRNRSTLHKLLRDSAMIESHDGPLPPDFGRG